LGADVEAYGCLFRNRDTDEGGRLLSGLIALASGPVNSGRTGGIGSGSSVFSFLKSSKHRYIKGICIILRRCNQVYLMECIHNGKIYIYGIEIVVWILSGLFLPLVFFEIDMTMPLWSTDFYLWYDWLDIRV